MGGAAEQAGLDSERSTATVKITSNVLIQNEIVTESDIDDLNPVAPFAPNQNITQEDAENTERNPGITTSVFHFGASELSPDSGQSTLERRGAKVSGLFRRQGIRNA